MRTWRQSTIERRCGACGKAIAPGAPFLEFQLVGVRSTKIRCSVCAGEASPIPTGPLTGALITFEREL